MWRPVPSVGPWRSTRNKAFCQIFMKFSIEFIYKHLSSNREVRKNRLGHSHTLFKDVSL